MAVYDRWYRDEQQPYDTRRRVRSAEHGGGKRWQVRWRDEAGLDDVRWATLAEAKELIPSMFEPVREYLGRTIGEGAQ